MAKLISQAEFARNLGVTKQYIGKLVRQGKLPLVDGKVDENVATRIIEFMKDNSPSPNISEQKEKPLPPRTENTIKVNNTGQQYQNARAAKETYNAKLLEIALKKAQGELISLAEIKSSDQKIAEIMRSEFVGLGSRLALRLENVTAAEAQIIVDDGVNEILTNLFELGKDYRGDEDGGAKASKSA